MQNELGENLTREWEEDPQAPTLWEALQLVKSDSGAGLAMLNELAESGSSLAMLYLGNIYLRGKYGIKENKSVGESWFRRAADKGSIEGAFGLAWWLLRSGRTDEALAEYERLSNIGYAPAQFVIAWNYYKGEVVHKDMEKAMHYFGLAEQGGHLYAANQIANILMRSKEGPIPWIRGLLKKFQILIPFVKTRVNYPMSDRLRT